MMVITESSSVAEIVEAVPGARAIFDKHGLHGCGGTHGPTEQLSFFASVHQVDLKALLQERLEIHLVDRGKERELLGRSVRTAAPMKAMLVKDGTRPGNSFDDLRDAGTLGDDHHVLRLHRG